LSRLLEESDFRARRVILEPDDFALGSEEPDPPPSDLIDPSTWRSITSLPDDVSIRTSSHFGSTFERAWWTWDKWNCLVGSLQGQVADPKHSPIAHCACDAADELYASIFNVLVGYYRTAFSCLRNIVEWMTIGLYLEVSNDQASFESWLNGKEMLKFGWAADRLISEPSICQLEAHWRAALNDDSFHQKNSKSGDAGGLARRLFGEASNHAHGRPGFTDADVRKSNGPVFVPERILEWESLFNTAVAFGILQGKLAFPAIKRLSWGADVSVQQFYEILVKNIPSEQDGSNLLSELPKEFWN